MDHSKRVERRLCLGIDMQGYGSRAGARHAELQQDLVTLLDRAALRSNLDRSRWSRQPSGDGEFAVLPADQPEGAVVEDFVRELAAGLTWRNEQRNESGRMRLRLAVHYGPVESAANGFAWNAPVAVGRLLESEPLRQALTVAGDSGLAVVLSRQVYTDTVLSELTVLRPRHFAEVFVRVKEFADSAWFRVPGVPGERLERLLTGSSAATGPAGDPSADPAGEPDPHLRQTAEAASGGSNRQAGRDLFGDRYGPAQVAQTVVEGDVTGDGNTFGFNFGGSRG